MIYAFDEADADLSLLPMASRRALDAAGWKLSLASYQTLSVADRRELLRRGAEAEVDVAAVRSVVARATGAAPVEQAVLVEPAELPEALPPALGPERRMDATRWQRLTGLDRYVLDKLCRANKLPRLRAAYDEIIARR